MRDDVLAIAITAVVMAALLVACGGENQCRLRHEGEALTAAQRDGANTAWPAYYAELRRKCPR